MTLDRAVEVLQNNPDVRIEIVGHTDNRGERDLDLAKRRAASVRTYLVEHGIDGDRITTDGMGPDVPAGRANNRRIEFEIVQRQ